MSFPCRTSKNGGQHKWSILKFITKDRLQFTQSCRYCGTIRWGKFDMKEGYIVSDVAWKYSAGLENNVPKGDNPIQTSDISTESGSIGPKD